MIWKVASLYIATVIGAGFATGQEVVQFFAQFGAGGLMGVVMAAVLLSVLGGVTLEKCCQLRTRSYYQLISRTVNALTPIFDLLYTCFILIGLAIMLAGSDAALYQLAGLKGGLYLTAVLVFIPLVVGPEQILNIAAYIVPLMVILIVYITMKTITIGDLIIPSQFMPNACFYSFLYSGYNLGFSLAVFSGIGQTINDDQKAAKCGGIIGGVILGSLVGLMVLAFFSTSPMILREPLPMLKLAQNLGQISAVIYTLVIWLAMYTTALANAAALTQRMKHVFGGKPIVNCVIIIGLALLTAGVGFVPLIKVTYPIFGLIGLYLIYKLLYL